jgi:hypothetical protein
MSEVLHLEQLLWIADGQAATLSAAVLNQRLARVRPYVTNAASPPERIEQVQVPEFLERRELYLAYLICAVTHDRADVCAWLLDTVRGGGETLAATRFPLSSAARAARVPKMDAASTPMAVCRMGVWGKKQFASELPSRRAQRNG